MRRCFLLLSFVSLACWQGVCGNAADLRLLEDLVRIPSVSADITNVNRAVDFAKTELERRGLFCSVETNEAGRKMLYAANVEDRKPDVVFACHLDVVSAQDPAQYEPRVSGGWLSGRGAADSKCHVVLAARVMEDLKGKVSVGALFATDEEMGGSTTRELINRGYGGKRLALVADAQPYTLTVWQKGLADYVIRVRKPAVHQGVHAGPLPNAIVDLMNGYRQLSERLPEYEDGSWREMFTCMEIGGVRDNAFLRLRVRPTRVEDWPRLERWIGECFAGGTVTCTRKGDPVYVDEKAPLVADFFAAMQARWPGKCTWRHNNSSNDSRHVQYLGLPMLIFGVETVGMHAADERVRLESIDEWAELLEAFLTRHIDNCPTVASGMISNASGRQHGLNDHLGNGNEQDGIHQDMKRTFTMVCKRLELAKSEILYQFNSFDPKDWTLVRGTPKWDVGAMKIIGGDPDESSRGQIFFRKPVKGDVVLEFDAKIVSPSYHDLVWFWNTDFNGERWGEGYLGCIGGWWDDMAGIEKLPDFQVSAIAPSFATEPGRTYHVISGSMGASHFIIVDGRIVTYFADKNIPDPKRPGYFGFGVYESCAEYSNLKVWRPHWTDIGERKYEPGTKHAAAFKKRKDAE